jgi:hypothetical protein
MSTPVKWKKTSRALLLAAGLSLMVPALAYADAAITVKVNGRTVSSAQNYLSDSWESYVDVSAFAEVTGIPYTLDEAGHTVTVGEKTISVQLRDGRPVAYVRALAEAAGASGVSWDGASRTVDINFDQKLVLYGDVVSSTAGCVVQNRFAPGDSIIFRMTAQNPITGRLAEDAKLQVHLSTGEVIDMHLGSHPPGAPNGEKYWTAKYEVTDQTPKGILDYYVTAETASARGEFRPFHMPPSLLTIVSGDEASGGAPAAGAGPEAGGSVSADASGSAAAGSASR